MKLFFADFGFCFGGTGITPATEIISTDVSTAGRRVRQHRSFNKNWRPELSAIAEDGGVRQQMSHESVSVVRSEKTPMSKARSRGKTRSHSFSGDYRYFTHSMSIPAFSPTPFVF